MKTAFLLAALFGPLCMAEPVQTQPLPTQLDENDPQMWLERMNRALTRLNYEGTFFHLRNGQVETLYIVHRVEDQKVSERLLSLDSNGREIIRADGRQICFLPDQRRVLVQPIQRESSALLGAPMFCRDVTLQYNLTHVRREMLSGRPTRVITVTPRDQFRFGYRLWLDEATSMPLKTQLRTPQGQVVEQILFAKLTLSNRIPAEALKPRVRSEGFEWVHLPASPKEYVQPNWRVAKLPPGFRLTESTRRPVEGAETQSTHLVYSDGLATVSVFVEQSQSDRKPVTGSSRLGSSRVYSRMVQGHQVTVVGEVPVQTLRLIAGSMKPEIPIVAAGR